MFGNLNQCGQKNNILGPISRFTECHGITGHSEISLTLVVSCSLDQRGHEKEESGWNYAMYILHSGGESRWGENVINLPTRSNMVNIDPDTFH